MFLQEVHCGSRYNISIKTTLWGFSSLGAYAHNGGLFCWPLEGVRGGMPQVVFVKCSGGIFLFVNYPHKNGLY